MERDTWSKGKGHVSGWVATLHGCHVERGEEKWCGVHI